MKLETLSDLLEIFGFVLLVIVSFGFVFWEGLVLFKEDFDDENINEEELLVFEVIKDE